MYVCASMYMCMGSLCVRASACTYVRQCMGSVCLRAVRMCISVHVYGILVCES